MLKKYSTLLGIGLLVLWGTGLRSAEAAPWISWLVGVGALCSFGIAAFTPSYAGKNTKMGEAVLVGTGMFILWILGMSNGVVPWMAWWTFAFACAFLLLGIVLGLAPEKRPPMSELASHRMEEEKERFRRGA
jgi:hypothetical protein